MSNSNSVITGFSCPKDLHARLEILRGDISRSKFLQRLVEQAVSAAEGNINGKGQGQGATKKK